MHPVEPIVTAHLFPGLHTSLLDVLHSLQDEDWTRPTAAGTWTVRDIVAHLVDGNVRQISFRRDGLAPVPPSRPIQQLRGPGAVHRRAERGVGDAFRRVSPRCSLTCWT
jgi:uncharacterized damage-inducible protein DinB